MNSIPIDLIHEIFSRLPIKSIGRFRCVSEQWRSILYGPDFTELFLTRSSARRRLLFVMPGLRNLRFLFSSPHEVHRQREKSSLADITLKLRGDITLDQKKLCRDMWVYFCGRASGLLCFRQQKREDRVHVICNPTTGQYGFLPKLRTESTSMSFLGFDPIDKIFKVMSMSSSASSHRILSLGTGKMSWRMIQCPLTHYPRSERICINGVLYYLARHKVSYLIVCFYVRSEKFKFVHAGFIDAPLFTQLINYKDKLAVSSCQDGKLRMWVLDDVEKQDWSEYAYTLPDHNLGDVGCRHVSVVGVTATGEIVILKNDYTIPSGRLYVFYFHPERNTIQRVEIQSFDHHYRDYACEDYVDDLTFPMKPHQQHDRLRFKSNNKFDALCLLDDV